MPEQESSLDRERAVAKELVTIMEVVQLAQGMIGQTLLPSEKAAIVGALLARGEFRRQLVQDSLGTYYPDDVRHPAVNRGAHVDAS